MDDFFAQLLKSSPKDRYFFLSRFVMDCNYYLGNGRRFPGHLWAGEERQHIENMKALWNSFSEDEKPEWLSWEDILNYEKNIVPKREN